MSKKAVRVVLSAVVLVGAVGLLLFTTMSQDAQAYKHVDEVAQNPNAWYGKSLQLHGFVTGQVLVKIDTLDYKFDIQNNGRTDPRHLPRCRAGHFQDGLRSRAERPTRAERIRRRFGHGEVSVEIHCLDPDRPMTP